MYVDCLLLVPPFRRSTKTLNFVHASSAFQDSVSECAERKKARVVETYLLQCLRSRGGISDGILNSVLLASLFFVVSSVCSDCDKVNSRVSLVHTLQNERPKAPALCLPQRPKHLRSPNLVVD